LLILTLLVALSRLLFQGEVFTFDYGIFQPDGSNYTFRTLVFMGIEEKSAAKQVSDWYLTHGINHNVIDYRSLLPENSPVWHLSAPRVLYPLLSIPFVYVFGIPGMLCVPILSLVITVLILLNIGISVDKKFQSVLFILLLLCSTTLSRWMIANLTDSLLVLISTLFLLLIVKEKYVSPRIWNISATLLVLCGSLTRFSFPLWFSLGCFVFFFVGKGKSVSVLVTSILGALPLFFFSPASGITNSASEGSFANRIFLFFIQALKVIFFEIAQLFVLDRILLAILVLSFIAAILTWRSASSMLLFAVFLSSLVTGSLNGVVGVNFRYYLPVVPFMIYLLVLTDWLKIYGSLNIKIRKSQKEL
jgi:hypothetical protein